MPAPTGVAIEVPPHISYATLPPSRLMLTGTSPVPHAPTATMSGLGWPRWEGPRFDHGCTSPQVMRSVLDIGSKVVVSPYWVAAPTPITAGDEAGGVTVPKPGPPLPVAAMYVR